MVVKAQQREWDRAYYERHKEIIRPRKAKQMRQRRKEYAETFKQRGAVMKVSECRSCGADIVWLKTELGKWMPVDADTVEEGDDLFDPGEHVSHFATCPDAGQHRKPR